MKLIDELEDRWAPPNSEILNKFEKLKQEFSSEIFIFGLSGSKSEKFKFQFLKMNFARIRRFPRSDPNEFSNNCREKVYVHSNMKDTHS